MDLTSLFIFLSHCKKYSTIFFCGFSSSLRSLSSKVMALKWLVYKKSRFGVREKKFFFWKWIMSNFFMLYSFSSFFIRFAKGSFSPWVGKIISRVVGERIEKIFVHFAFWKKIRLKKMFCPNENIINTILMKKVSPFKEATMKRA